MSLEPITPEEARELYLADRENEVTQATLYSHRSRLGHFLRWADREDIDNMNELSGRLLHKFRVWRRSDGDLAKATEKTEMDTVRVWIKWLEKIDGCVNDLHTKVRSPTLTGNDNIRDVMLESEQADEILSYLRKYEYASRPHLVLKLGYHTMMRVGAIHALDCSDYDSAEQAIEVVHRPSTGTPIKNAEDGERYVALSGPVCDLIDDWLDHKRPVFEEASGRRPLITSAQGRVHQSTLRNDCYRYTRPCMTTDQCPHDREIDECEARPHNQASKCPSSKSPHTLRRGGITAALNDGAPRNVISDRCNLSERVLEMHYDQGSKREKMERRRKYLDKF